MQTLPNTTETAVRLSDVIGRPEVVEEVAAGRGAFVLELSDGRSSSLRYRLPKILLRTLLTLISPGWPGFLKTDSITEAQMEKFLRHCQALSDHVQLTENAARDYVTMRAAGVRTEWWLTCDFDLFLKSWEKIFKCMLACRAVQAAQGDLEFQLNCLAFTRPAAVLDSLILEVSRHLAESSLVRCDPAWELGPEQASNPAVWRELYLNNLRDPEVLAVMQGDVLEETELAGYPVDIEQRAAAHTLACVHTVIRLIESTRRGETWPELADPAAQAAACEDTYVRPWLKSFLEHYGVFKRYPAVELPPLPADLATRPSEVQKQVRSVRTSSHEIRLSEFRCSFSGRVANLAYRMRDYEGDLLGLDKLIAPLCRISRYAK